MCLYYKMIGKKRSNIKRLRKRGGSGGIAARMGTIAHTTKSSVTKSSKAGKGDGGSSPSSRSTYLPAGSLTKKMRDEMFDKTTGVGSLDYFKKWMKGNKYFTPEYIKYMRERTKRNKQKTKYASMKRSQVQGKGK
jgi:hypothetical protein